jgi:hypothetical protein
MDRTSKASKHVDVGQAIVLPIWNLDRVQAWAALLASICGPLYTNNITVIHHHHYHQLQTTITINIATIIMQPARITVHQARSNRGRTRNVAHHSLVEVWKPFA